MKNTKHEKSLSPRSVFQFCLRHFTLAILTTIVLSGCNSGGGGGGSSAGNNSSTNSTTAVIASGTVDSIGGTIADSSGNTVVIVPPGTVAVSTVIQVKRGRDANGNVVTTITSTPPTNGQVQIIVPDPTLTEAGTPLNSGTSTGIVQGVSNSNFLAAAIPMIQAVGSAYPDKTWLRVISDFWDSSVGTGFGNRIDDSLVVSTLREGGFEITTRLASEVLSVCDFSAKDCYQGKTAVLFIHGYFPETTFGSTIDSTFGRENGLGGGKKTWGEFPNSLQPGYVPFEFRWVTAARFEDVAKDLCQAVDFIAERTGKQVHIVAHSFGGVLTRVYLQGLSSCSYRGNVASVTTLGSPHSGLFDTPTRRDNVDFSTGQDTQALVELSPGYMTGSLMIDVCKQLSCYEVGEAVDLSTVLSSGTATSIYRVSPSPGEIAERLYTTRQNLPPVPIQVLIGMTTSRGSNATVDAGDGLISYEGQRFLPEFTANRQVSGYAGLLNGANYGFATVTEKILGFPGDVRPDYLNPLPSGSEDYVGYRHSGAPVGPSDAIQMAYVGCTLGVDLCGHSGLKYAYSWIVGHPAGVVNTRLRFTLRVRILDSKSSAPVSGASVEVKSGGSVVSDPIMTGQDGYVDITVQFLPQSDYDLIVTKTGYYPQKFSQILRTGNSLIPLVDRGFEALTPETSAVNPTPVQYANLTVTLNGTGSGNVVGTGIECPVDCMTSVLTGLTVVLTPTANAGSLFSGWNTGCTWTEGMYCFVTLGADTTVSASFSAMSPPPAGAPAAATNLMATAPSQSNVSLVWLDNADNETGFKIEQKVGAGGTFTEIAIVAAIAGTGSAGYYGNQGLVAGTTYCYRLRAYNAVGNSAYTTESCATTQVSVAIPTVTTAAASNITNNSATLNGGVNPNGVTTNTYFKWGTTTSYGNTTPSQGIGSGATTSNVTANISGLAPNTTYHFQIVATYGSGGTVLGLDQNFTTSGTGGTPGDCPTRTVDYDGPGADGIWRTVDDSIKEYNAFTSDTNCHPVRVVTYRNAGPDGAWFTADDEVSSYFSQTSNTNGDPTQVVYYNVGPDGVWLTADDAVQLYSSVTYDANGSMIQSVFYSGPGVDSAWFTADDVVGSHISFTLGSNGKPSRDVTYWMVGADNTWFTADDGVAQYFSHFYDSNGNEIRTVTYYNYSAGADGILFTADDVPVLYWTYTYDANGYEARMVFYSSPGADGVWFTADDVPDSYVSFTYDANGYYAGSVDYSSPGADGVWFTGDDVLSGYSSNTQ